MELFNNSAVLGLSVFDASFHKKETIYVPPRRFHSLTLRLSGEKVITAEGKTLRSASPCITYIPKNMGYHSAIPESGRMLGIHFDLTEEADSIRRPFVFTPENPGWYQSRFDLLERRHRPGLRRDSACLALFYELLGRLAADLAAADTTISSRMQQAKAYFDSGFSDPRISVGEAARALGVSEVYLRREFKAAFGVQPLAYLQKLRLESAADLLESGYYTVGQVAEKCGYSSLSYFSSAFRRATGMAPTQYSRTPLH